MPPRTVRKTNQTILFAVEGDTELAFLTHVKGCYGGRDCNVSVRIRNARGHGPLGIVDALISGVRGKSYDFLAAMLDSDIPLCDESKRYFKRNGVTLFQSNPAIEGTILKLGNNRLLENAATGDCKRMLAKLYPGDSMDVRFYERHFNKEFIDANRGRVLLVDELIDYLTAPK
ncbi:hypothetical protein [Pseudomonas sp. NPDC096950]|uniref:hypothetical protein n=1 Tax=Pseudomonas sp. NPDC096950 TaxID=3364485 RepID=UPI00383A3BD2